MRRASLLLILSVFLTALVTVLQCYIDYKQSVLLKAKTLAILALGLGIIGLLSVVLYLVSEGLSSIRRYRV